MAGIGNYEKDKPFTLKSGNTTSFKSMGSSPLKSHDGTTSSTTHYKDGSAKSKREVDFSKRHEGEMKTRKVGSGADSTEGQDQDKIFNDKGKHVGNWKGDKKVMLTSGDKAKAEHPKYDKKTKKKKSPLKCPLLAALPMITQVAGAVGAVGGAAKAMKKDKE